MATFNDLYKLVIDEQSNNYVNSRRTDEMRATIGQDDSQTFYPIDKAKEIADELQKNDDDWTYKVVEVSNGRGRIDVYDEDDELIKKGFSV